MLIVRRVVIAIALLSGSAVAGFPQAWNAQVETQAFPVKHRSALLIATWFNHAYRSLWDEYGIYDVRPSLMGGHVEVTGTKRCFQYARWIIENVDLPAGRAEMHDRGVIITDPANVTFTIHSDPESNGIVHMNFYCATRVMVSGANPRWVPPNASVAPLPTAGRGRGGPERIFNYMRPPEIVVTTEETTIFISATNAQGEYVGGATLLYPAEVAISGVEPRIPGDRSIRP